MIASGPSAGEASGELAALAGRGGVKLFAINEGFRLANADALYACDGAWWRHRNGVPEFAGLKLTSDAGAAVAYDDVHRVTIENPNGQRILTDVAGVIGSGGNSGFQALNLAAQFGPRRIVLVGYDMRLDRGVHWHGRHPAGLNNPSQNNIAHWRRVLDAAAGKLAALGIDVVNASSVSTLAAYRRLPLSEAIA